jgi:hypothetical protein
VTDGARNVRRIAGSATALLLVIFRFLGAMVIIGGSLIASVAFALGAALLGHHLLFGQPQGFTPSGLLYVGIVSVLLFVAAIAGLSIGIRLATRFLEARRS